MKDTYAPIILFTYKRLGHTQRTVESLLRNNLASSSELIIYIDGPRSDEEISQVGSVKNYVKNIKGFKSLHVIEREINFGLSKNIIEGVTEVLGDFDEAIIIEDDLVTSPFFLEYMNISLRKYLNETQVASIHGYTYPVNLTLPETFFLRGADCWGWGTWRDRWTEFNQDPKEILEFIRERNLEDEFNYGGYFKFTDMLENKIKGRNDSWAILWHGHNFLQNKLTLYPGKSLVQNIGNDNTGEHSDDVSYFDVNLSKERIEVGDIKIEESKIGKLAYQEYFKQNRVSFTQKLLNKLKLFKSL